MYLCESRESGTTTRTVPSSIRIMLSPSGRRVSRCSLSGSQANWGVQVPRTTVRSSPPPAGRTLSSGSAPSGPQM